MHVCFTGVIRSTNAAITSFNNDRCTRLAYAQAREQVMIKKS